MNTATDALVDQGLRVAHSRMVKAEAERDRLRAERAELVAALREQVQAFGAKHADEQDSPRIASIRALLHSLGEDA